MNDPKIAALEALIGHTRAREAQEYFKDVEEDEKPDQETASDDAGGDGDPGDDDVD